MRSRNHLQENQLGKWLSFFDNHTFRYRVKEMNADLFKKNPASFLEEAIKEYVVTSPNNTMPDFPGERMWDEPLVGFADGDDPLLKYFLKEKVFLG
jgi:hypothetical protein